ncbi:MAG TPA: ABC-F family ATP-binding cassette domain-containing protein [Acidimicrobiales bacterium]|nr:ABC-F family ATP-binding cassette domain-containing protein [Acidimicrobiales bacterium]
MPSPSSSLVARDLAVAHGTAQVLDGVDLDVGPRSRVGVVGPNGAGKTTLLRVLAGLQDPDRGTVVRMPPTATVGYLPQEPDRRTDETLYAFLARRTGVAGAEAALDAATAALAQPDGEEAAMAAAEAYAVALDHLLAVGGTDLEARAAAVCDDLGLPADRLEAGTAVLSGGEAARASLAAVLLSRFDVFLLDEPTNDLDFAGLDRLERFLDELAGGVVVVSHDRAFLDRTITSVLELDEASHGATLYNGGWSAYLEDRAVARRHAEEAYAVNQTARQRLAGRAQTQRLWATTGVRKAKTKASDGDKHIRHRAVASSEKQAAKARQTERAMERLEVVDKPWEGWELHLEIAAAPRSGDVVARLDGAEVTLGTFRLGPVDLEVGWGERVALLGPNGSGKTTLLQALLGRVELTAGTRWLGPGVVVGEMEQSRGRFVGDETLLDAFTAASGTLPQEARSLLAKFGMGAEHVARTAATLSPGERTRAALALLMARGVNCLVLDEPTNHLDLPAIEQLEQALDTYDGTLLLVTHDRRLLEAVRTTRSVEVRDGTVVA